MAYFSRRYPDVIDVPLTLQLQLPDGVNDIINELKDLERVRDCVNGGSVGGLIPFQHFPKLHQIVNNWTKASGLFGFGAFNQDAVRELSWKIVAEATSANITLTGDTSDTKLGLTRMLQTFFEMHNQCYEPSHIMLVSISLSELLKTMFRKKWVARLCRTDCLAQLQYPDVHSGKKSPL